MPSPTCVRAATATSRPRPSISSFVVEEGTRAYIERINIRGNIRTRDYVIRREFDIGEGDAYNRALIDRAERRLKNLNYFKTVKITNEPGSAPDRVVINVDVEEQATGEFSVAGGYSTADGFHRRSQRCRPQPHGPRPICQGVGDLWPVCAWRRPVVRRALSARLPRWPAASILFARQNLASSYVSYDTKTYGTNLRLGFALTEELSLQPRYSIYRQEITLPTTLEQLYLVAQRPINGGTGRDTGRRSNAPSWRQSEQLDGSYCRRRQLLRQRRSFACGAQGTGEWSSLGFVGRLYAGLQHSRQQQSRRPAACMPRLKQDFAGVGGDVNFIRSAVEMRNYYEVLSGRRRRSQSCKAATSAAGAARICACWITSRWARISCAALRPPASARAT